MELESVRNKVIEYTENVDLQELLSKSDLAFSENKIPKIIHFCFLDYMNMSEFHLNCLSTWFDILGDDWTFVNWTPRISEPVCEFETFVLQENKFAFYSDYMRVRKVWDYGGFYMDCDVVLYKDFSPLLDLDYAISSEFEKPYVEPAVFGAKRQNKFIGILKDKYESCTQADYEDNCISFLAPVFWRNTLASEGGVTVSFKSCKDIDKFRQKINNETYNIMHTLDTSFLGCPHKTGFWTGTQMSPSENTFASHMFAGTWSY